MLLEPGDGDVAASDLQIRLDLAQLTAAMALLVGPEAAAELATRKLGTGTVTALVPLLQPVVLHRSTRAALRRRKDVLPALRKGLLGSEPDATPPPVQLERIRPRGVLTLVAAVIAAYIVIGQFNRRKFLPVLENADWRWVLAGLALAILTYVGATLSLTGLRAGEAQLGQNLPGPVRRVFRHAGHAGRRRGRRAEHPLPAQGEGRAG